MAKVIDGTKWLEWGDLTPEEQARVIKGDVLADDPSEYSEFFRMGGEIYLGDDEHAWFIVIPNEHEGKYPERFSYQDEGSSDDAEFTQTALIPLTCTDVDETLMWKEYLKIDETDTSDFTVV